MSIIKEKSYLNLLNDYLWAQTFDMDLKQRLRLIGELRSVNFFISLQPNRILIVGPQNVSWNRETLLPGERN